MATPRQLSNLALLLRGGVGAANARRQGPYENERSMFANRPLLTPKPLTTADHRASPPSTPLPKTGPVPGRRPAQGGPRIPIPLPRPPDPDPYPGAANTPDPYRNFPLPTHDIPQSFAGQERVGIPGGPGGGTLTGQRYSSPGGPGGGTMTGQPYPPGLGVPRTDIPTSAPAGQPPIPGLGHAYGGFRPASAYNGIYQPRADIPTSGPANQPPFPGLGRRGGPGGGIRTGQDWPSIAELPGAGGDPNAPNWYEHGSRYSQTMPNAESQRTPYQNSMPNVPDEDPWRQMGGGLMQFLQSLFTK